MARKAAARASDTEGSDEQEEKTTSADVEAAVAPVPGATEALVVAPQVDRVGAKVKSARKIKLGAFKYRVPSSMNPGVQRGKIAYHCVGDIYPWPDGAYQPGDILSNKLIPLDEPSREELVRHEDIRRQRHAMALAKSAKPMTAEEKIKAVPKADVAPEVTITDDTLTVAELARRHGGAEVRVSDK